MMDLARTPGWVGRGSPTELTHIPGGLMASGECVLQKGRKSQRPEAHWKRASASSIISSVTLAKSLHLFEPQVAHLYNGNHTL